MVSLAPELDLAQRIQIKGVWFVAMRRYLLDPGDELAALRSSARASDQRAAETGSVSR